MTSHKSVNEIKFSKLQALASVIFTVVAYVPVSKMIVQGSSSHNYYWFIVAFIISAFVFWKFIRPTLFMIANVPAIILSANTLTITEKGYDLKWRDIASMNLAVGFGKTGGGSTLVIEMKDPWEYISKIKNPLTRYYRWYAKDAFNSFSIQLSGLEGDSNELYNLIETYYHQHKQNF